MADSCKCTRVYKFVNNQKQIEFRYDHSRFEPNTLDSYKNNISANKRSEINLLN